MTDLTEWRIDVPIFDYAEGDDERNPNVMLMDVLGMEDKTTAEDMGDYWVFRYWEIMAIKDVDHWFCRSWDCIKKSVITKLYSGQKKAASDSGQRGSQEGI
jgi:hypothetical protein